MVEWRKVHFEQQEDCIQKRKSGAMAIAFSFGCYMFNWGRQTRLSLLIWFSGWLFIYKPNHTKLYIRTDVGKGVERPAFPLFLLDADTRNHHENRILLSEFAR